MIEVGRRTRTSIMAAAVVFGTVTQFGCGTKASETNEAALADVIFEGKATKAALQSMLSGEPQEWEWSAGVPKQPANGEVVSAAPPAIISWVTDLVHEDQSAAKEKPLAGVAFLLVLSTPTQPQAMRVFTTLEQYTPSAGSWTKLAARGEEVTVRVNSADFEGNKVIGEGPFSGLSATFRIESDTQ